MYIILYIHISVTNVQEENGEPSENFLTEVRSYFEQQKIKKPTYRDTRHANDGELIAYNNYVTLCV